MSVQSEMDRIKSNIQNTYSVLSDLGADVPSEPNSNNLAKAAEAVSAVLFKSQDLTSEQKQQARTNIGAASQTEVTNLSKEIDDLPNNETLIDNVAEVVRGEVITDDYLLEIATQASKMVVNDEVNMFSFANANANMYMMSKNASTTDYIYSTTTSYGTKDTENKKFVCNGGISRYAILGGLETPLPVGSYTVKAELLIPSGSPRTKCYFTGFSCPSYFSVSNTTYVKDLGVYDTWVEVEGVMVVSEGDTVQYITVSGYGDTYPIHIRNIKVIPIGYVEPDMQGWEGKRWVVMGDSLTESNQRTLKNYHDYIAQKTGIEVVNMGASGTGYMKGYDSNNAFYQRISNVPTDADVVTIFGSGNDCGVNWDSSELGNPTDTGTNTICGCINTTIDNLYAVLPTVKLGIITPTPWKDYYPLATTDPQNRMTLYSNAIVEICRLRGIPCLDLYHCSGLRPWDSTFRTLAYSKDDGGGTHPDEKGHEMIAPMIFNFLESIVLID